jgi:invasion protein IalB
MRRFLATTIVAAIGLLLTIEVMAQSPKPAEQPKKTDAQAVDTEPQSTTASFGDWVLRCQRLQVSELPRICEVAQTVQVQGQQNPIAELAIGRLKRSDPLRLTVILPVNVTFPSTPRMALDTKDSEAVELTWRRCLPGGCIADAVLKDDLLRKWRASGEAGRLEMKDAAARDISIKLSLRGLAQALDALEKTP